MKQKKIWAFDPKFYGVNFLIDATKQTQYLTEIKDSVVQAFMNVTKEGILCEEILQGSKYKILDAVIHSDRAHRGDNQIIQCARNAMLGAELLSEPRLVEPIYLTEIMSPSDTIGAIYQCLNKRKGVVFNEEYDSKSPMVNIKAFLPVKNSFGFNKELKSITSGRAFPQLIFDHWEIMKENPLIVNSSTYEIMMEIRKRIS